MTNNIFAVVIVFVILIVNIYDLAIKNVLIVIFLCVATYYLLSKIIIKKDNNEFIEKRLLIGKKMLLDNNRFSIIVVRNKKILWGNDLAYEEFPILLEKQSIESINLQDIGMDGKFIYNNKIYKATSDNDLYLIENITKQEREIKNLVENKPNIGILQLDNYDYISQNIKDSEFLTLAHEIRIKLINYFEEKKILFTQLTPERYQLIIPTSILLELIENKFEQFNKILDEININETSITYSLGIGTNFSNIKKNAEGAQEALDLAINRGGSQVIVLNKDEKLFFNGKQNVFKGSTKSKARIMANTTLNITRKRDVVYIMTHNYPDSDALSGVLLMKLLLEEKTNVVIKIVIDKNISDSLKKSFEEINGIDYYTNVVIDKTKHNLLIVVDTQSSVICSHPELLKEIDDVIVIDHHQTPVQYIENSIFNWIESSLSSTTELIMEMLNVLNIKIKEDLLSEFALLAIITDTNNFNYRTNANTLETVGTLVSNGADISKVREKLFLTFEDFLTINKIISNVYIMEDFSIIRVQIESDDILLSMCANTITEIQGVKGSIIISEIKDNVNKVKIRTNKGINARGIIEPFGGGGHARQAAGVLNDEEVFLLLESVQKNN